MSKIYRKYLELKQEDSNKYYLFRCGNFYIFLDEDARKINNYAVLKLTNFSKDVVKCGFPIKSLDNYMKVFNNQNLNVEIIEHCENTDNEYITKKIYDLLEPVNLDHITPIESLTILAKIKEVVCGK